MLALKSSASSRMGVRRPPVSIARSQVMKMRSLSTHTQHVCNAEKESSPSALAPPSASNDNDLSSLAIALFLNVMVSLPAGAEEVVAYNAEKGDFFKNAAGVGYTLLVGFFFARLFSRRSKFAKEYKLGSTPEEKAEAERKRRQTERVTWYQSLGSGIIAAVISAAVFFCATKVDGFFEAREMPSNYTARNITVTVETIVRGLVYLCSFIFGANSLGMIGLGLRLITNPELGNPETPVIREPTPEEIRDRDLRKISASQTSSVLNSPVVSFFTGIEKTADDTSRSGSSGAAGPSDRRARPSPPSPVNGAATSSAPPPTSGFLSFNRLSELNDPSIDFTEKLVKKKPATTEEETSPRGGAE